jgi:murein DD-endopeptidase MepM/ murein hydrolase activator NlpD
MELQQQLKNLAGHLKRLKGLSVIFLPDYGKAETRTYKFGVYQVISIFALYTSVIAILGFLILGLTPLKSVVFPGGASLSDSDKKKIDELNQRISEVTLELNNLKDTNQKLKYAIGLGDSTLLKETKTSKDSADKKRKKNPFGGNIFAIVNQLFQGEKNNHNKSYYFTKPADGFISRGFNPDRGHMGIDFVVKTGTPVYAAANGYVVFADYTTKDGYMIILIHDNGYITVYKHCSVLLKRARESVLQGETIALSGNTGEISTGPHLHFEIWKNGEPINPETVLINY